MSAINISGSPSRLGKLTTLIFGFLVIIDSNRAQKENKKNKKSLLDSLNNEN